MKNVMFHVKHSESGDTKAKEYGVVHVQMDLENVATWFVLVDKDGCFSFAPAHNCKFVHSK